MASDGQTVTIIQGDMRSKARALPRVVQRLYWSAKLHWKGSLGWKFALGTRRRLRQTECPISVPKDLCRKRVHCCDLDLDSLELCLDYRFLFC